MDKNFMEKIKRIKMKLNIFLYKLGIKSLDAETILEIKKIGEESEIDISEFYDVYIEPDIDTLAEKYKDYEFLFYEEEFIKKPAESLSNLLKNTKIFSRNLLRSIGYENEIEYFKRVILYMIIVFIVLLILGILDGNILGGLFKGIFGAISVLVLSIFYPKIRLIMFKEEVKLQVLFTLLYMVSILRAGASLPEILETISKSNEYGFISFEARSIIRDVNVSGYTLVEALERAKLRTEIPLLKKLYDQMIIGYNKGNLSMLLEKLYEDIVRDSLSKLDSSKFMIQNLGNLTFGVGLILPFAGMILSTMISNQGFPGILNTLDLLLTKIGPLLTLIFGIFVKLKID
ncbi:type II secretion system F family protein [Methanocaldococcus fervens]|uniref:Type II secretion system F domain protein n=1 Tax=Methanocaldococcus fervens (strain DSM 4213 / JCM 15782 / AG86) TaxID=573064 RepID=C7P8G1_METFA|nr:type II secretion system F family protein [Methanocaldococcus fervens]ACV24843.1 Type II secretion system F domain protein [Methanocaldococcus fervens AG86]